MKLKKFFDFGVTTLLLALILHMHICSSFCATGVFECGDDAKSACCSKKNSMLVKSIENKELPIDRDCQKNHFDFFNLMGKKSFDTHSFKIVLTFNFNLFFNEFKPLFLNSGFLTDDFRRYHPPPIQLDVPIYLADRAILI